VCVTTSLR